LPRSQSPSGDRADGSEPASAGRRRSLSPTWANDLIPARGCHQRNPSPFSLPFTAMPSHPSLYSLLPMLPLDVPSSATTIALHHHPSGGSGPPSSPRHVAPGCNPSYWLATPGATVHRIVVFFCVGHHRPPCSVLLRAVREYRMLRRCPLLLSELKFYSGNHLSTPPSTISPPIVLLTIARLPQ
jgi:hypothetical protein